MTLQLLKLSQTGWDQPLSPSDGVPERDPPPLFTLASDVEGITRNDITDKLSLYADNLLLYVSNLTSSILITTDILTQFGRFSGYKLNFNKSELLPINPLSKKMSPSSFPFRVVAEGFRYLSIFITASFKDFFNKNFRSLIDKCKLDLTRWSSLPLSLTGRINLVKMVILPKLLDLFQYIPFFISWSFFKQLDHIISSSLWLNKPPCIRKAVLQLPKKQGGFALPNLIQYYWACNINKLCLWLNRGVAITPPWALMEIRSSKFSLYSLLTAKLPLKIHDTSQNPVVTNSPKIWMQFRKHYSLNKPSTLARSLSKVKDLYKENIFTDFTELAARFELPHYHFFRFLQTRHFIQTTFPHFPNHPLGSLDNSLLTLDPTQKRSISVIYNLIDSLNSDQTTRLKQTWEEEIGASFSDTQWDQILKLAHTSSICARKQLAQRHSNSYQIGKDQVLTGGFF